MRAFAKKEMGRSMEAFQGATCQELTVGAWVEPTELQLTAYLEQDTRVKT